MSLFTSSRPINTIETTPLLGAVIALALGAFPLAARLAGWVLPLFLICCTARLLMNRPASRLPSLPTKVILFVLGIGGVGLTYGSMLGIDPGLSILLVLVSLKLIETNGERDFHVLALLGYFLALCGLFFSQDLLIWLYVALIALLLTAALVRFHRGAGNNACRRSTVLALTLFAQALPVVVLLFLFFPRVYGGFRFQFSQSLMASGGMSDRLAPGSFASLALSDQIAFRADFPDGSMPAMSAMYWRGGVLWRGEGLTWVVGPRLNQERRLGQLGGAGIRQRISLLPHGARWLFALDRPASEVPKATYQPGGYLQSRRAITSQFRYEVVSRPDNRETTLPPDQRVEALRLPSIVSPRVRALVERWKKEHPEPRDLIETALYYFRREHFTYTLSPGTYQDVTALDAFLFERREGFCEHYAASFASLMRVAGIPSRVIIGYHGGEFNALGRYVIVRQADAHAWCEVWLKDVGWQRVDPTDMIAPERISAGLASYLQTRAAQTDPDAPQRSLTATGWRELQREMQRHARLLWDSINYQWDLRVLNFDEETQRSFLFSLGLGSVSWPEILIWVGAAIALLLAILALWLRHSGRSGEDRISEAYARFCQKMERAGLRREAWEGPQHFGERAAARFAAQADVIRQITSLYIQLRYGVATPAPDAFFRAVQRLPKLAITSGT
jgi:transglutaminase-like putative cysteine protease